jgi:hypothetical protein
METKITTARFSGHAAKNGWRKLNATYPFGQPVVKVD